MVALSRDVAAVPFAALQLDVALLLALGHRGEQLAEAVAHRVLAAKRDEDELEPELAELGEGHRVGVLEPLERRGPIERELSVGEALLNLGCPGFHGLPIGGRELAPHEVGYARVEIAQSTIDRELKPARWFPRIDGRNSVRA